MGTWFTGAWVSVVIFSPITPNANFVETHMFLEFQNNRHDIEFENSFSMYAVHVCTNKHYVKIIYITFFLNFNTNVYVITT